MQRFNAVLSMVCSYPRCVEEGCLYCCKMQSPTHLLMRRDFDPRLLPAQGSSAVLVQRFNAVLSMVCSYPRCVEEGCLYCCKMQSPTHLLMRRDFDPRLLPAQGSSAVLVQRFNAVLSMVCSYPRCVEEGCLYCCKMQSPTHLLKRRDLTTGCFQHRVAVQSWCSASTRCCPWCVRIRVAWKKAVSTAARCNLQHTC